MAKAESKDKLLEDVLTEIEREYGKGSIMKLGDRAAVDVEPIPSGSLLLDQALGIGGYPKGRIIEIFGPESSDRTSSKERWTCSFYRCRKCYRPSVCT